METKKLTRSMAISFIDDPYLAILAKRIYDKNIKDEVDELLIAINGENKDIVQFILNLWSDVSENIYTRNLKGETVAHGEALNQLYGWSKGDIFITLDSDNFIYHKGVIDEFCSQIEVWADAVISKGPMMAFFRKSMLDKLDVVDFREEHIGDKFKDTMRNLMDKLDLEKTYIIGIDDLPHYEHIGRMSAFPMYVEDCWFDSDSGLDRAVRKLFGRVNRVALIKYIFDITHKDYPDEKYNKFYYKTFQDVIADVGHKEETLNQIIEDSIRPKFKDYEKA